MGQQAGHRGRRLDGRVEAADWPRQPAEHREEHEDEYEAEPKIRDRARKHAVDEQHLVAESSALDRRIDADRNAKGDRDHAGRENEFECRRKARLNVLNDTLRGPP